jgi:hypothetical protein
MKQLLQWILLALLGVPAMVLGYLGTYVVFGVLTGHQLYKKLHLQLGQDQ